MTEIPYLDPGSAPQNFTAVASGRTSAWFSWEPPSVDDHTGVISYYLLRLVDASFNLTDITINTTNSSYSIEMLEEYVRYSCQVAAGTAAGVGPYTTPLLIITQQDGEEQISTLKFCLHITMLPVTNVHEMIISIINVLFHQYFCQFGIQYRWVSG